MIFDWFKIFNLDEFTDLELGSKTYTQVLEGIGEVDVLVTKGIAIGMLYDGVFLSLGLDENPFEFEDYAIYQDGSNDVWLGILNED